MNGLAICAGIGGLELGLGISIPEYKTICYIERECYSAATIVARMEDKTLDQAPIWDDLTTFNSDPWRGKVDIISSGFPCQPWSQAGKRKGTKDERWLWPNISDIIRDVQPRYVFLENVPGLLAGGIGHVLGSLAEMGFDAEWGCFSAAQMGGSHIRERVFLLADSACNSVNNNKLWSAANRRPCQESNIWPPLPNEKEKWGEVEGRLKPAIRRVANGSPYRVDRLRALGNGVVPLVAANAYRVLSNRLKKAPRPHS